MSGPKIFIVVLLLIGILFIVGIGLGATRSDNLTFQTPPWVAGFGTTLVRPQPLKIADLSPTPASCLQRGRIVVSVGDAGACTFAVQQSSFALRVVTLQLVKGVTATVALTQEEVLPVQQPLMGAGTTTTADLKVYPGKAHGVLSIKCLDAGGLPASACLLELK